MPGPEILVCAKNTPLGVRKSIGEVLRGAKVLYDCTCNIRGVVRIRPRLADYVLRGEKPDPTYWRDVPWQVHRRAEFNQWFADACASVGGPWAQLKEQIPNLVAIACDGRAWTSGWRAPAWLLGWPDEIRAEDIADRDRLDEAQTATLLKKIESYARKRYKEFTPAIPPEQTKTARARGQSSESAIIDVFIANIKRDYPEIASNIQKICILLDKKTAPLPSVWRKAGKKSWSEAWADPKFRPRVKRRISPVRPALGESRVKRASVTATD
jgi:hypothetical protein